MTPSERVAAAKEARKAQRAAMRDRQAAIREKLEKRRQDGPPKRRNPWIVVSAVLFVLLLLSLLRPCREEPEPLECPVCPDGEGEPVEVEEPERPLTGRIPSKPRPAMSTPAARPLPWLSAFRMQVEARSPRLAQCFEGSPQPGSLKWTTSVEPRAGRVSASELEPMLLGTTLTSEQRTCVLGVLTEPAYNLPVGEDEPSTPAKVGLVIEF